MTNTRKKPKSPTLKDIAVDFGMFPTERLDPERLVEQPTRLGNWIQHFLRQSTTAPIPEELITALKVANDQGIDVKTGRDEAIPTARDLMLALGVHWAMASYYGECYVDDADPSLIVDKDGEPIGEDGPGGEKMDVACLESANRLNELFAPADGKGLRRFTAEELERLVYRARRSSRPLAFRNEAGELSIRGFTFGIRDIKKPRKKRRIR